MAPLRRLLAVVLIPFALASAAAEEPQPKPKQDDRLVVRAKLPVPPAPPAPAGAPAPAPAPLPDVPVVVVTTDEVPARALTATVTVGDGGAIEAVVTAPNLAVGGCIEIRPASGRGSAVIAFRDELRGDVDVGALAFGEKCPVLVSGRVETAQKTPVAGAAVNVRFQTSPRTTLHFPGLAATTDATGAFAIRADVRNPRGVMFAETEGRWQTQVPASLLKATKDLRLVAAAAVEVRGSVEVPAGLDASGIEVVVAGAPGSVKAAFLDDKRCTPGGEAEWLTFPARATFVLRGLVAGNYDLRLRFRDGTLPLAEASGVVLDEKSTDLPRLRVERPVRRVLVRVVSPEGTTPSGRKLWVREKGDRGKFREVTVAADGTANVSYVADEVSLAAHAAGTSWAFATTSGAETSLPIVPLTGTPVRVLLPDNAPRGGGDVQVSVTLAWRGAPELLRPAVASMRDATDPRETEIVELPLPLQDPPEGRVSLPGWYEIALLVRGGGRSASRTLGIVRIEGADFRVIPLEMSAKEMNEIVRSMDER